MAGNAVVSYVNYIDLATISDSSGYIYRSGFPLANVKVRQLGVPCIIENAYNGVNAVTVTIIIDLGVNFNLLAPVAMGGMLGCNVLPGLFNTLTGSCSIDTGTSTSGPWTNRASTSITDLARIDTGTSLLAALATPLSNRYWRIVCSWSAPVNGPAYIGRLWLGNGIIMPKGCDAGFSVDFIDAGKLDPSVGQQNYEDKRIRVKKLNCNFGLLNSMQAFGFDEADAGAGRVANFQDMQYVAGLTGEMIVLPRTSTGMWISRLGTYGHAESTYPISNLVGPNYGVDLSVIEER